MALPRDASRRGLAQALRAAAEQFRGHVSGVEASFVVVNDMDAEDGIKHLEGQLRTMTAHYVVVSDLVGAALRAELGWLPEEEQGTG